MTVGEWLHNIGLGQYEAALSEHDIDWDVLPDLTEADLKRFGVPLGPRKRLMKADRSAGDKLVSYCNAGEHSRRARCRRTAFRDFFVLCF